MSMETSFSNWRGNVHSSGCPDNLCPSADSHGMAMQSRGLYGWVAAEVDQGLTVSEYGNGIIFPNLHKFF